MSYDIHQIPGSLRIKSPVVRRNEAVAVAVETFLKTIDGIRSVAVNTLTGSITVHYNPRVVTPEIGGGKISIGPFRNRNSRGK